MAKTIAVIGLSPKPDRPSYEIYQYLKQNGYRVFGVNPGQTEILGDKVYSSLLEIPEKIAKQRGRYLDAIIDSHKYNAEGRAVIFGEPDFVYSTTKLELLTELPRFIDACF